MSLPILDLFILVMYVLAIVGLGAWFGLRKKDSASFMIAGGKLPGWVVGLSIFGTYLSSNTFLGVPGKAFSGNWNSFVFSLSIPLAAWLAIRYFVPFYRNSKEISAYHHLEKRFGRWARIYAVLCFMLTQLARIGSVMFGVGLVLNALLGIDLWVVILVTGVLVTLYTLIGGIEAVIWTDVVQSVLLTIGAILILTVLVLNTPGGIKEMVAVGIEYQKFSLGSWHLDFSTSTVWVVLLYGFFINLANFGIDQNYIQRYHAAQNEQEASKSVWLSANLYVPVSLLFFVIGTALFAFVINNPEFSNQLATAIDQESILGQDKHGVASSIANGFAGDQALPYFIAWKLPSGLAGLIIAALFAAAMSTIDSSLNSSATIYLKDIHSGQITSDEKSLSILKTATLVFGVLGTSVALAMIGVKSVLDTWWLLSGIFSGGLLGLFILGLVTRAGNAVAIISVAIGILVILWMTAADLIPESMDFLRSPFHANMILVIGTLAIFLIGLLLNKLWPSSTNNKV